MDDCGTKGEMENLSSAKGRRHKEYRLFWKRNGKASSFGEGFFSSKSLTIFKFSLPFPAKCFIIKVLNYVNLSAGSLRGEEREMKTLSVRFYKRLILVILALMILVPTVLAIFFGLKSAALEKQLAVQGGIADPNPTHQSGEDQDPPVTSGLDLIAEPLEYQTLYPELYGTAQIAEQRVRAVDTVYLTFDCDPSSNTMRILDILDTYSIKATFFVGGTTDEDALSAMKEIVSRGHSIGLRSYSSSYQAIYQSVETYLEDFNEIYQLVYETTGVWAEIFRFPAGSVNSYNGGIYRELIGEMLRRNFVFFDWNVSGGDSAVNDATVDDIRQRINSNIAGMDRAIVQLRDVVGKDAVVEALPGIIEDLQGQGYSFQPLTAAVLPIVFSYKSAS